jgi:hypothetical protein
MAQRDILWVCRVSNGTVMDICGFDSHFVVTNGPQAAIEGFVRLLSVLWPSLLVSVESGAVRQATWRDISALQDLGSEQGEAYFARDREMVDHFEVRSYTPLSDGSGVVAVLYAPLLLNEGTLVVPDDVISKPTRSGYKATVVFPANVFAFQLITPDDPASAEFSRSVRDSLVAAVRM